MGHRDQAEPAEVWHVGPAAVARLAQLGLVEDDVTRPLDTARADAVLCTELDAPGAPGYIFWSRANRHFRENLIPKGWGFTNRDNILRTIHPQGNFAITAMSGDGKVGVRDGRVRTKNPKGAAVAALVRHNYSIYGGPKNYDALPGLEKSKPPIESGMMPTWFLLYKWTREGILHELSLPTDMLGSSVNQWKEHILLGIVPFSSNGAPSLNPDIFNDDPGDNAIDVPVERRAV